MTAQKEARGAFLALVALKDGPKHGYEVASFLRERSGGFFTLSFGALYPILHRLEREGLAAGDWHDLGPAKRKKVYRLTRRGEEALASERERARALAGALARLLGEAG
jgi:PadR family transcriptional regulator, regulatory protein PadR